MRAPVSRALHLWVDQGDDPSATGQRGLDAGWRVLENDAPVRGNSQPFGGRQEDVGRGLGIFHQRVVTADDGVEMRKPGVMLRLQLEHRPRAAGGYGQATTARLERSYQLRRARHGRSVREQLLEDGLAQRQ